MRATAAVVATPPSAATSSQSYRRDMAVAAVLEVRLRLRHAVAAALASLVLEEMRLVLLLARLAQMAASLGHPLAQQQPSQILAVEVVAEIPPPQLMALAGRLFWALAAVVLVVGKAAPLATVPEPLAGSRGRLPLMRRRAARQWAWLLVTMAGAGLSASLAAAVAVAAQTPRQQA